MQIYTYIYLFVCLCLSSSSQLLCNHSLFFYVGFLSASNKSIHRVLIYLGPQQKTLSHGVTQAPYKMLKVQHRSHTNCPSCHTGYRNNYTSVTQGAHGATHVSHKVSKVQHNGHSLCHTLDTEALKGFTTIWFGNRLHTCIFLTTHHKHYNYIFDTITTLSIYSCSKFDFGGI